MSEDQVSQQGGVTTGGPTSIAGGVVGRDTTSNSLTVNLSSPVAPSQPTDAQTIAALTEQLVKARTRAAKLKGQKNRAQIVSILLALLIISGLATLWVVRPQPWPSTPRAQITFPEDYNGQTRVPEDITAAVDYFDIPSGHYLWTIVRIPKVWPMRRVYPQLRDGIPAPVTGSGQLKIGVTFGGPNDAGAPFNLEILLVDKATNQAFLDYAKGCVGPVDPHRRVCDGLPFPGTGVEVLDFVTVIRE